MKMKKTFYLVSICGELALRRRRTLRTLFRIIAEDEETARFIIHLKDVVVWQRDEWFQTWRQVVSPDYLKAYWTAREHGELITIK